MLIPGSDNYKVKMIPLWKEDGEGHVNLKLNQK